MAKSQSPFRFDHREVTVIVSLFVFTSLLMFTVGIVVGKGISQTKNETNTKVVDNEASVDESSPAPALEQPHSTGTSVSTGHNATHSALEKVTAQVTEHQESQTETGVQKEEPHKISPTKEPHKKELAKGHVLPEPTAPATPHTTDLELIPEKQRTGDVRASLSDLSDSGEVEKTLRNPKIKALLEDAPKPKTVKRKIASTAPTKVAPNTPPKSFPEGKYTVQIGSYPSQADASLRLEQLRAQGYPFAYMSTKELGEKKEPWYRVWLGYFPDAESAKAGGELLQQRGEVKSYLVRKSENQEDSAD